jgi:hypothetical protein
MANANDYTRTQLTSDIRSVFSSLGAIRIRFDDASELIHVDLLSDVITFTAHIHSDDTELVFIYSPYPSLTRSIIVPLSLT